MNKIIWEYWANPLDSTREEYTEIDEDSEINSNNYNVALYDDGYSDIQKPGAIRLVVPTVAGLMPIHAYGNFSKNFNFWMMNTNFNISEEVIGIIKEVPGVEFFDVITRYRARVGFGKCFNSVDVKDNINKIFITQSPSTSLFFDSDMKEKIDIIRKQCADNYKNWAIYVIPNGEIDVVRTDDFTDYEVKLELLYQAQKLAGGMILTHNDK